MTHRLHRCLERDPARTGDGGCRVAPVTWPIAGGTMREDHAHGGRLERPRRLRPSLIGRPELGRLGWIVAGVLGLALIDRPSELDCALATRTRTPGAAVSICE